MKKRLVVKVGSNVLTTDRGKLDITRVSALVDQIAWLREQGYDVVLVTSGAVACGRGELQVDHLLDSVEQRQLFSAVGQAKLMGRYVDLFRDHGIHVGQVLTMKENFVDGPHRQNQQSCMTAMLNHGVLPIVNENDTVAITELMFTDNDELSGLIAEMMQCKLLILLSNIDGIYDADPSLPDARIIREVEYGTDLSSYIQQKKSSAGRGGMSSKYQTASSMAKLGIHAYIANGKRENILTDLLWHPERIPFTHFKASR